MEWKHALCPGTPSTSIRLHAHPHSVVPPGRLHGVVSADTVEEVARRVADMGGEDAEDGAGAKRRKGGKRWVQGGTGGWEGTDRWWGDDGAVHGSGAHYQLLGGGAWAGGL